MGYMFARVSILEGKPEQVDKGIRHYREQLLPEARRMAGFKGAYLLVDRKSGRNLGITLWDTEKSLQASSAAADRLRAQGSQIAGTDKPPTVEIYEVAVQT
jgi:heme-degrading monooxygenase HmoA